MNYKIDTLFWDMNESTGMRNIRLVHDDRTYMAVLSHYRSGVWSSSVVPMGFSLSLDETIEFSRSFQVLPDLMRLMESPTLTLEEIQEFLLTVCADLDIITEELVHENKSNVHQVATNGIETQSN